MPDQEVICRDCGTAFLFTEAEQEFFRAQGFAHAPKRCKTCRAKQRHRSARRERAGVRGGPPAPVQHLAALHAAEVQPPARSEPLPAPVAEYAEAPARTKPRGPMHPAVCSVCGLATEVPFRPDGVRPVYCLPCLKRQTR